VVVVALTAERIAAALRTAVRTNRRSAVSTFSHSPIATGRSYVTVTGYVFDLASMLAVVSSVPQFRNNALADSRDELYD
jgi:hypothetical protein